MKRVLVLDNQLITPPESGGPLRIVNIFGSLPSKYEVHYLCVTGWQYYKGKEEKIGKQFYERVIPVSKRFIWLNNFFTNIISSVPAFDALCSKALWLSPNFNRALREESKKADIIVSSHPWMFHHFKDSDKIKIYDSHNCEYMLYRKYFRNIPGKICASLVKKIEREACLKSDVILACSKEDAACFEQIYGAKKIKIVPNPVDTEKFLPPSEKEKTEAKKELGLTGNNHIVFTGSRFLPNIEAFDFIARELVPKMHRYKFLIAGNIDQHFYENLDEHIKKIPLKNMNFDAKGILGYGWFDMERWGKEGFSVRWTKKKFSILIKDKKIEKIRLQLRSRKILPTTIRVNGKKKMIKTIFAPDFKNVDIDIGVDGSANIDFIIHNKIKAVFTDFRDTGLAVRRIQYLSKGAWKEISLNETCASLAIPKNLVLYGKVPAEKLKKIYAAADLAINPVSSGSGINIKMLDYFACGIPVITTPVGARGLELKNEREATVCELSQFKKKIENLTPETRKKMARRARDLVAKKYSNESVGAEVGKIFDEQLAHVPKTTRAFSKNFK